MHGGFQERGHNLRQAFPSFQTRSFAEMNRHRPGDIMPTTCTWCPCRCDDEGVGAVYGMPGLTLRTAPAKQRPAVGEMALPWLAASCVAYILARLIGGSRPALHHHQSHPVSACEAVLLHQRGHANTARAMRWLLPDVQGLI